MNTLSIIDSNVLKAMRQLKKDYNKSKIYAEFERSFNCHFVLNEDGYIKAVEFNTDADLTFFLLRWE